MWYFRQRTRKWSRKFSKIIFSSRKIDLKKYIFPKFPENPKYCFWNFEILIFGSSSGTPIAPYALVDVSWMVFDGFRAKVALARLLDNFSADFNRFPFRFHLFTGDLVQIWNFQFMGRITHPPRDSLFSSGNWIIMKIILFNDFWQRSFRS